MDIENLDEAVSLNRELTELETALCILNNSGNVIVREQNAQGVFAMLKNDVLVGDVTNAIRERIAKINERIEEL